MHSIGGNGKGNSLGPPQLVVGIGASAGGLKALKAVFSDPRLVREAAYVVTQHMDVNGRHLVLDVLRGLCPLDVVEASNGLALAPGRVHVVPPHHQATVKNGKFKLVPVETLPKRLSAIDALFRSLAEERGPAVVGVVLSGEGSDGTEGLKAINERGGMTIVQDPATAEHVSMPHSAIAAGAADHVLAPEGIDEQLRAYAAEIGKQQEAGGQASLRERIGVSLPAICDILQRNTNHDFRHYKTSTLLRRIQRRMQVRQVETVEAYVEELGRNRAEADALFNELLINVTSFFRDPEAFEALRADVIPRLLTERPREHKVRVWVAGCSTGEEAYTLAMLFREEMDKRESPPEVQIIATDIDEHALAVARKGAYPVGIAAHVGEERLRRFFVRKAGRYHVTKELREICLFSSHNLINDPPFSQIDMVSCRNVMIYLGLHLQKKLIPVFHYALRPNGYLFLGTSESLTVHKELFRTVNARFRIAQRKATAITPTTGVPGTTAYSYAAHFQDAPKAQETDLGLIGQRIILDEFSPRYAIVNDEGQVLTVSAGIAEYFEPSEGPFQNNVAKLAKAPLRVALRTALREAQRVKRKVVNDSCTLRTPEGVKRVEITVQPMPQLGEQSGLAMVIFRDLGLMPEKGAAPAAPEANRADAALVDQLERELTSTREDLDKTVQELEASNEELKSSNEELLSMNEELQSANEELEASKEEVQRSNEALQRANTDLENLLASTRIATLFLDEGGAIKTFTPSMVGIYNLIPRDVGRPVAHITHNARAMPPIPNMAELAALGGAREDEVAMADGAILLRRVLPYKDMSGDVAGIVVTFTDVTELRRSEGMFRTLADALPQMVWVTDAEGGHVFFNHVWQEATGLAPRVGGKGSDWLHAVHPDDRAATRAEWEAALASGEAFARECRMRGRDGRDRWHLVRARPYLGSDGRVYRWFGTCTDMDEQMRMREEFRQVSESLSRSQERFAQVAAAIDLGVWFCDLPFGRLDWSATVKQHFWLPPDADVDIDLFYARIHPEDRERTREAIEGSIREQKVFETLYRTVDPARPEAIKWIRAIGWTGVDAAGTPNSFDGVTLDITAQVEAEARSRENEERYRVLTEVSPHFVWLTDASGAVTFMNQAWEAYTSLGPRESLGRKWLAAVHPDERDAMATAWEWAVSERGDFEYQARFRRAGDRSYRWHMARALPVRDGGKVTGWVGVAMDIHDDKTSTDAVRANELRYVMASRATQDAIWDWNLMTGDVEYNEALTTVFLHPDSARFSAYHWWIARVHPDDVARIGESITGTMNGKSDHWAGEYRFQRGDGTYAVVMDRAYIVRGSDGTPLRLIGAMQDITRQREVESRLRASENRFRSLADSIPQLAWMAEPSGAIYWFNKRWYEYTGATQAAASGWGWTSFLEEERVPGILARYRQAVAAGESWQDLYPIRGANGALRWFLSRALPIRDDAGELVLWFGTSTDVTERMAIEAELKDAKEAAEHANMLKSQFLANMSHEIRTPIGIIQGFLALLKGTAPTSEEFEEYVQVIDRNSQQVLRLIDDILDLAKVEAGKIVIEAAEVPLRESLREIGLSLGFRAREKGLAFAMAVGDDVPERVVTDPTRFRQILLNLINNAVKFTEHGRVAVTVSHAAGRLRCVVEDTGIGLDEAQAAQLFKPFSQGDASMTRRFGGNGLGLALSKRLAEAMGGSLQLERSAPGEGSAFAVEIPMQAAEEREAAKALPAGAPEARAQALARVRVLLVEDSPDNQFLVGRFLRMAGAHVEVASDGRAGVDAAMAGEFDIVLMDVQMPVLDGYGAMQELRAKGFRPPIVALTAHAMAEERQRCLDAGATAHQRKPIDYPELIATIRRLIDAHAPR